MKRLIAALGVFLALSAQASETDLIGTYAARDKGELKEVLRIEREADHFILFDRDKAGQWRKAKEPMQSVTREQWNKLLRAKADPTPFDGLGSKGVALFKVPRGWQSGKFKTETGYFMLVMFGPVELHKL